MVEVTKIFARSGCDMYGRIHGGETLLYWVERWSEESQDCALVDSHTPKFCSIWRLGTSAFEAFRPWLQMLPLQPRKYLLVFTFVDTIFDYVRYINRNTP